MSDFRPSGELLRRKQCVSTLIVLAVNGGVFCRLDSQGGPDRKGDDIESFKRRVHCECSVPYRT